MAQPTSIANDSSQKLDPIVRSDGGVRLKLAVGTKAASGLTNDAAWQGVATHTDGATFASSDGLVVQAGVDGTTVRKMIVDSSGRPLMLMVPNGGNLTDPASNAITAGGTDQTAYAANLVRKYLLIQNLDSTEPLWVNFGAPATEDAPSIRLDAGAGMVWEGSFVPTQAVHVIAATTAHAFTAKEG